jgi:hypothetical protein
MQPDPANDPVMRRFRNALEALYGERLERGDSVRLTRPRGRTRGAASDYDVAVFLRGYSGLWTELQPLGAITTEILHDTDAVISPKPFPEGAYHARTLLMGEIRRAGVDL